MNLTAREEIVVELFRALDPEQRGEAIKRMRALVDANRVVQQKLKGPLRVVGNMRVEERYGIPTPKKRAFRKPISKPQPRRPDRNQDDAKGET